MRPRWQRRFVTLLVGVLVATGSAFATPSADKSNLFRFACEGFGAFVPVDAATARAIGEIPGSFKLQGEDTGKTVALVAGFDCEYVLDGEPLGQVDYSNVTVNIEAPPAVCPQCGAGGYDVWQFTTDPQLHASATRIGVFEALLEELSVSLDYIGRFPVSGHASVPWESSPYEITATIGPDVPFAAAVDACSGPVPTPTDPAGCFPSDHWHEGPQGIVYAAHSNCNAFGGGAAVTIEAEAGSPLARLLGAPRIDIPGVWLRFDGTALMDFAEHYASGEASRPPCEPV